MMIRTLKPIIIACLFTPAAFAQPPVVLELFTSKFCPNCPAAEKQIEKMAAENNHVLVLQQHVDYWDRGPQKDPYGSPDLTQRQYDYSNTVGRRPGEVFTPQPILDGTTMLMPPLGFGKMGSALEKAQSANTKAALAPTVVNHTLLVELPEAVATKAPEVWVFGTEPIHNGPVHRVLGMAQAAVHNGKASLSQLPKGKNLVVIAQSPGGGPVLAVGQTPRP
jgi:hypothetical protein